MDVPPIESFGRRITVCGPSNSGKSTLAVAIGRKLGIEAVHLDRLYHVPKSNWVPKSEEDFVRLHDAAIAGDEWVMDGNYSRLFAKRLPRATGIVLITDNRWANLRRYFVRTLFQPHREGSLGGNRDSVKWLMIRWIVVASPRSVKRYREELPRAGLPFIERRGMRELNTLYAQWGLTRA